MAKAPSIYILKNRPDFLAVAATGFKKPMSGLVLQAKPPGDAGSKDIGVGITASRRTGGAVERNRIKRRLRQVIMEILPAYGLPGYQYVVIGRKATLNRPYNLLQDDLKNALAVLHKRLDKNV